LKKRVGFWLNITLLFGFILLMVFGFLHIWVKRQVKVHRLQIQTAYGDLDKVFPVATKKKGAEPDLENVVMALNEGLSRSNSPLEMDWHGRKLAISPLQYRHDQPDGRWQMVLSFDKSTRLVHAAVYGKSLTDPVTVRDYPCCR